MATSDAPISISKVSLTVNDIDRIAEYYQTIVGLQLLQTDGETRHLGVANTPLLELRQDRHARQYPQEAGLFHNAFLLPERADLGRWLRNAFEHDAQLTGVTDHRVSEALYLRDPEGNGIEIYVDRPRSAWIFEQGEIRMDSRSIDLDALSRSSPGTWKGAPEGTTIGHVHLQVGNIAESDGFYRDKLGLTRTASRPSASFYASGGYHHHLAGNIWNSDGAGQRSENATGLAELELKVEGEGLVATSSPIEDPWGTKLTFRTVLPGVV